MTKKTIFNGLTGETTRVDLTTAEQLEHDNAIKDFESKSSERKLTEIRNIRDKKLNDSDWQVTMAKEKGTNLTTSFKNWRQGLRDIPTTYTTESEYDELLATDDDENLTHSVWSES